MEGEGEGEGEWWLSVDGIAAVGLGTEDWLRGGSLACLVVDEWGGGGGGWEEGGVACWGSVGERRERADWRRRMWREESVRVTSPVLPLTWDAKRGGSKEEGKGVKLLQATVDYLSTQHKRFIRY